MGSSGLRYWLICGINILGMTGFKLSTQGQLTCPTNICRVGFDKTVKTFFFDNKNAPISDFLAIILVVLAE